MRGSTLVSLVKATAVEYVLQPLRSFVKMFVSILIASKPSF